MNGTDVDASKVVEHQTTYYEYLQFITAKIMTNDAVDDYGKIKQLQWFLGWYEHIDSVELRNNILEIKFNAGEDIQRASACAYHMHDLTGSPIYFNFNGTKVSVGSLGG